jgi:hypothetical protein
MAPATQWLLTIALNVSRAIAEASCRRLTWSPPSRLLARRVSLSGTTAHQRVGYVVTGARQRSPVTAMPDRIL